LAEHLAEMELELRLKRTAADMSSSLLGEGRQANTEPATARPSLTTSEFERLRSQGWVVLPAASGLMSKIAASLGEPTPSRPGQALVDLLRPIQRDQAHPRSLSAMFGLDALPFHSDAANWPVPCRYVLLAAAAAKRNDVPTLLVSWRRALSKSIRRDLVRAVFLVRNGRSSFYTTALDSQECFLRHDPGCMQPIDRKAIDVGAALINQLQGASIHEHTWLRDDLLVIDNWSTLHGRPAVNDHTRELRRVMVMQ
jgi:hypothetical protein